MRNLNEITVIDKGDVREGDTIRITRDVKVKDFPYSHSANTDFIRSSDDDAVYSLKNAKIELIKRPMNPLPTEPGSVIRIDTGQGSTKWMRTVMDSWLNTNGDYQTEESLMRMIDLRGWKVEVML